MPSYVRATLHTFQNEKPKRPQNSPYPWTQPNYENNNQILPGKVPAELLDEYNKKRLQKIVGKCLYYVRAIDNTTLMALT